VDRFQARTNKLTISSNYLHDAREFPDHNAGAANRLLRVRLPESIGIVMTFVVRTRWR
jgi:hypothetical protein